MMCGLLRPTAGRARVAGLDLYQAAGAARTRLGYMAQKFSLYGDLSVQENLDFFAGVYGLSGGHRREANARMVQAFDLVSQRDQSAGVLPLLLLFIFAFGVTLDLLRVPIGVVVEQSSPEADSFLASFRNSRYFEVRLAHHRAKVQEDLVSGRLKGVVILAADFSERLGRGDTAPIQVILDGSDPNTAGLVQNYVQNLWANWVQQESVSNDDLANRPKAAPLVP
jgi:ABC-2 family transporter protein